MFNPSIIDFLIDHFLPIREYSEIRYDPTKILHSVLALRIFVLSKYFNFPNILVFLSLIFYYFRFIPTIIYSYRDLAYTILI